MFIYILFKRLSRVVSFLYGKSFLNQLITVTCQEKIKALVIEHQKYEIPAVTVLLFKEIPVDAKNF